MQTEENAKFEDAAGREWEVRVLWGHPSPTELGIHAVRFDCVSDPSEPVRVGFADLAAVRRGGESALREALEESDPADAIG